MQKKQKKEKKEEKESLSPIILFYIVSAVVVVVVVVVDSFFLSAFERERRTERERERKERVFLRRPFFSQSFQVRSCKVIVRLSLLRWRRISLEFRNRFLFSPI